VREIELSVESPVPRGWAAWLHLAEQIEATWKTTRRKPLAGDIGIGFDWRTNPELGPVLYGRIWWELCCIVVEIVAEPRTAKRYPLTCRFRQSEEPMLQLKLRED